MSITPGKSREIVLQLLYAIEAGEIEPDELILFIQKQLNTSRAEVKLAFQKAQNIFALRDQFDKKIQMHALSYAVERIGRVERNVLRIALYETLTDQSVPQTISISEALRITKKFSSPSAATFVHAILTSILTGSKNV